MTTSARDLSYGGDTPDIELRDVSMVYRTDDGGSVTALAPTDLTIPSGQFVAVVGPSGCGKTTLLKMLAGFITPTTGQVIVDGERVTGPGTNRGVVFQQANLYPWLTVRGNVELAAQFAGTPKNERREISDAYLEMVGLSDFADRRPYELSGGMQQRAQIARVLAADPEVILMDEPFGALDALTRERLQNELLAIWRKRRRTVFFITHSVEEAVYLSNRTLVMSARPGRIIRDIPVDIGHGGLPDAELRVQPEFARLRDEITTSVYEAQGVVGVRPANAS